MKFAITKSETPLLSTEHFSFVFSDPLPLDPQGLLKPIETIAFAHSPLILSRRCSEWIYEVEMPGYPEAPLFADIRFLEPVNKVPKIKEKTLPPSSSLVQKLESLIGNIYIWGGNWHRGIPELLSLYPPSHPLDPLSQKRWTLEGVDCSGLLYQVTEGLTPRNTSQLLHFGHSLQIEGLPLEAIVEQLQPLDLIVWSGHMVIVLDNTTTIESSCSRGGVVTTPLEERLSQILEERTPSNLWQGQSTFVIRRFIQT